MNTTKQLGCLVLLVSLMPMIFACSTKVTFTGSDAASFEPVAKDEVKVTANIQPPANSSYEIVGRIFVVRQGYYFAAPSEDYIKNVIRERASEEGADAAFGFYTSLYYGRSKNNYKRWGSAVAVRMTEAGDSRPKCDFCVALLPVSFPDDFEIDNLYDSLNIQATALRTVQRLLERKGYAVQFVREDVDVSDPEAISRFRDENWASYVLSISVVESEASGISSEATLDIDLISLETGEPVLQARGRGKSDNRNTTMVQTGTTYGGYSYGSITTAGKASLRSVELAIEAVLKDFAAYE